MYYESTRHHHTDDVVITLLKMFRFDQLLEELSDAKQAVGGQRHADDDDGRYITGDHLQGMQLQLLFADLSSAGAAAAAAVIQSPHHHFLVLSTYRQLVTNTILQSESTLDTSVVIGRCHTDGSRRKQHCMYLSLIHI